MNLLNWLAWQPSAVGEVGKLMGIGVDTTHSTGAIAIAIAS